MRIATSVVLILLVAVPGLGYFAGCVAVPDQAVVVSGALDQELQRQTVSCGSGLAPEAFRQEAEGLDPSSFSILSWNSHRASHQDWHRDLLSYGSGADLILLQEAALDPVLDLQTGLSATRWLMAPAFLLDDQRIGIMSVARVGPQSYCVTREPEPLLRIPKIGLAATYPLAGLEARLLVVNIHMINFSLGVAGLQRQIEELTPVLRNHQGPVIIAGDFNTWSDEREGVMRRAMAELGMSQVAFNPDDRVSFFDHKVDGVYYRGLEVTRSLVYRVESSDHNPIEVHFRVSGRAAG